MIAAYKRRLATVRAELQDIDDKTSPLVTDGADDATRSIALAVCRIVRILGRVIDSLPG